MNGRDLLSSFRGSLPRAGAMQIGAARIALLREIKREHDVPTTTNHLPAPLPRLTLSVLVAAAILCCALLVVLLGIVPRAH